MFRRSTRRTFMREAAALPAGVAALRPSDAAGPQQPAASPAARDEIFAAGEALDTLAYSLARYDGVAPALTFRGGTRAQALRWQERLRRELITLLGGFPSERAPLRPRILQRERMQGYTREKVLFWSRHQLQVFGYLLLPDPAKQPLPAMICLPGHGRGVDDIVGIEKDGTLRREYGGYQKDFALQCIEHGLAAFALEQFGFGHRRDEAARKAGPERSSCQPSSGAAFLLGETMAGWRTWDVIRAIDYLETRPEIDPRRIGCMGISGGGTVTLYAAAVEPRINVAWLSGSYCTYRDSIFSINHCIDNYVPGLLKVAEAYDVAGLAAPRAFFVENGERDPIFPVKWTLAAFERLKKVYAAFGAEDKLGLEIFPADHQFWGTKGFEFVRRRIGPG